MNTIPNVSAEFLDFLRRTDTCLVSNAIENFKIRMRNEGYIHNVARCVFPEMAPVAGFAVTGRIRTTAPPISNLCYYNRPDWWRFVASLPAPKIVVVADVDRIPGSGALFGEIHARIAQALGCVAYVTNGTVRDVPGLNSAQFQCFASGVSVSHSYAHVIDFGEPVDLGGLTISTGDLLHGDLHGIQKIPVEIADQLPAEVGRIVQREADLMRFCQSPDFSLDKLEAILTQESPSCQPSR